MPQYRAPATSPNAKVELNEAQLKSIFQGHDKNGDGRLDKAELKEAFKQLGALVPGWRAWRGLQCADADNDGYISEDEMKILVDYALQLKYTVN